MRAKASDVVIIGGGVVGLACALELLAAGRSVHVLERDRVGAGASHGNAGLVTPSHATPLTQPGMVRKVLRWMLDPDAPIYVRPSVYPGMLGWGIRFARSCGYEAMQRSMRGRAALLSSSRELFDDLLATGDIECDWETRGLLLVFATAEAREGEACLHRLLAEHGIEIVPLDASALVAREPALRDDLAGGTWYPQDAHLRPDRLLAELARLTRERGGVIEEGCEVVGFARDRTKVTSVRTSRGELTLDHVVLATGAWAPRLGRELGMRLPVQPGKGYSVTQERPASCPEHPMILEEVATGVTPWANGLRLAGTMEFSGFDDRPRPRRFRALRAGIRRYLRNELTTPTVEEWFSWRAMTPDELPIIGRTPRYTNAFVATGHGRMGVGMSTGTAKLVTELITGTTPHVDPAPYDPLRFRSPVR